MRRFLIANQAIMGEGGSICRLLSGFEDNTADETEAVCSLTEALTGIYYNVINLTPDDYAVGHVFSTFHKSGGCLVSAPDYSRSSLWAMGTEEETRKELLMVAVYSALVGHGVLLAHGALVELNGHGVMFVGDSGIGKTTQAILWNQTLGARIINGDKVFLSVSGNRVIAHGSPWNGNSPYRENASVALSGIVLLGQASENTISRLTEDEKLSLYLPRIFLPTWDENLIEPAMNTASDMLPLVPVFRMFCRPDQDAVMLAYHSIFG